MLLKSRKKRDDRLLVGRELADVIMRIVIAMLSRFFQFLIHSSKVQGVALKSDQVKTDERMAYVRNLKAKFGHLIEFCTNNLAVLIFFPERNCVMSCVVLKISRYILAKRFSFVFSSWSGVVGKAFGGDAFLNPKFESFLFFDYKLAKYASIKTFRRIKTVEIKMLLFEFFEVFYLLMR